MLGTHRQNVAGGFYDFFGGIVEGVKTERRGTMRMGTGRRNRRQPDQNRRKREGTGQAWGQRVRQRALALCLCAAMLLGQTTPVLAAEVTGGAGESTVVRRWSWVDQENLIAGDGEGGYTLAVAGEYSAEEPLKQEQIRENLPSQILAEVEKTASEGEPAQPAGEASEPAGSGTETGDRQPSAAEQQAVETKTVAEAGTETETLNLTWDLSSVPETGIYAGNYELNAALPEGYVLADGAPALKIRLEMDSPNTQQIPEAVLEKNRVETTTPVNTKLNLFDYWVYGDQTSNDWIRQDKLQPPYSSHTAGINQGHPLLFGNGMGSYSNKYYYGLWNTTAPSWNDAHVGKNHSWMEGIVSNRLGEDGMPQINEKNASEQNLATKVRNAWDKELSLGYLFDPSMKVEGRAVYKNVRNLFLLENGNYKFHSSDNYAQFVEDHSTQDSDGYFHVYNTWAVQNGNHRGGNFAPFNTAQQLLREDGKGVLVNAGIGCTQNQYGDSYNSKATSAGTTPKDTTINHYLGATMETSFIQPENGMVKGTSNDPGDPMTFSFTGDNDVWIFIDDVLVGDLGGLHAESFITIDFSTGYIYRGPVKKDGTLPELQELKEIFRGSEDGKEATLPFDPEEQPNYYKVKENDKIVFSRTTIKSMHDAAKDDTQTWREGGYTYGDDTIHTLKFFYLERGGYDTNISLDFNLVSVPNSAITKVDQDSDPVVGAEFALYAAFYDEATKETKIRTDYNEGKPICTAATDREGRIVLVNDKRQIIQFDKLKENYNVTDYILRETKTPLGYRSRGDIALYYDNGIVLVRNYLTSGAYSSPILNVTMDNELYNLDKPGEQLLNTTTEDKRGIIFAVPLKLDSSMAGKFDKEDKDLASKLHPISGNFSDGWTVMAEGADLLYSREDKEAIVAAAKSYQEVAEKNSRNVYALTLDNIPGAAQKQYWYVYKKAQAEGKTGEELKQYVKENTGYIVGFYYAPDVRDIEKLTADTPIHRILDTNFETKFTSQLHIPNSFNRLRAQKMDYHGNAVAGATIGLYQLYCEHDHDGTGGQYLPVKVYGKPYYINTQMFDLTDADKALIRQRADNNPVEVTKEGSGGKSINEKKKTYAQLKEDWDKGEGNRTITPWDWGETKEKSFVKNLELNGTMSFPSAYDSEKSVEDKNDIYDVKNTHTYLEVGYYLMCELEAPNNNYVLNETLVPVEVTADNIYANAGEKNNGVRVGMYVGFPQGTMKTLAQEDAMDATLTFLNVQLKRIKERKPDGTWDSQYDDILEGLSTYQYKYDNTLGYYQRYVQEGGTAYHMKAAANLYLFTSEGHPMLRVEQDNSKKIYTFTLKNNYKDVNTGNTNRNGKLILQKEKKAGDGSISITRQVVNVSNGCATFRLAEGEKVSRYEFLQSDPDNSSGSVAVELLQDTETNPKGDFVVSQPRIDTSCAGQDISRIFASSTLVQFFDLDQGDMTVKVVVDHKKLGEREEKPFYFRLYALYDKVTEIQLFDKETKEKSTFDGTLNVRIGLESAAGGGITTGEYDETETRTVSVEFKKGLGKLLLSEGYNVKTVRIPENEGHGAHGLVAFIPYQIQLTGDKADYTGKLTVSAQSVASGNPVKNQSIAFTNGQAVYYAANATKITGASEQSGGSLEFTATSQWAAANANELFSESPLRKVNVTFHTEGATSTDIITKTSEENGATKMVDVTKEEGNYYLTLKEDGEGMQTNPFLGGKAVTADFALYDGQSVTIENLPGGITYFVQEWSLGESTKETQYNENINEAYQLLTEKYFTTAERGDESESFEYEQEFRTAKRQLQIDLTQKTIFHNVRVLGGLIIEKKVAGNAGDRNRTFTFNVELNKSLNGEFGDVKFENGKGTIQLKHGERAVITGLTAGTICTVKEETSDGYETTYAQHQQNEAGNETEIKPEGTAYPATGVEAKIAEDTQNVLTFTNRKDMVIDTGIDLDRTPYILILAITGAGVALFFGKKRKRGRNKIQF